uniref:Uncharacterized protein n=1 Tax=Anguilla anguilla TaxID=7936 RepID=A0A0E9TN99_ANGAN
MWEYPGQRGLVWGLIGAVEMHFWCSDGGEGRCLLGLPIGKLVSSPLCFMLVPHWFFSRCCVLHKGLWA